MELNFDPADFSGFSFPIQPGDFIGLLYKAGYCPEAYRDHFDDLANLDWASKDALNHFLRHGLDERRHFPIALDRDALVALAGLPISDTDFKAKLLSHLAHQLFAGLKPPFDDAVTQSWPTVIRLAPHRARPFFLTGDSHACHLDLTGHRNGAWLLPIHMPCTAGSAAGLDNAASRSGYGDRLRAITQTIASLPGTDSLPFLFQFGQVDIEFVYHFHRVRDGRNALDLSHYRAFCDDRLERYSRFVSGLFSPDQRSRVFLTSIFPPALSDEAWSRGYVNGDIVREETDVSYEALAAGIRTLDIADFQQRTEIHLYFNAGLKAACQRAGFGYLDVATGLLGQDGLVDPRYIVPETKGFDHHLDGRRTHPVISDALWQCLDAVDAIHRPAQDELREG